MIVRIQLSIKVNLFVKWIILVYFGAFVGGASDHVSIWTRTVIVIAQPKTVFSF